MNVEIEEKWGRIAKSRLSRKQGLEIGREVDRI